MEKELIKLWVNDKKRREFVWDYKSWGVWFVQEKIDCVFYRYVLPDGFGIIAMEYMGKNYYPGENEPEYKSRVKFYLRKEKYFSPDAVSESYVSEHLKGLKAKLQSGEVSFGKAVNN